MNMCTDYNPRTLAGEIKDYFNANDDAIEVLILKGKRKIVIERIHIKRKGYTHSFISSYNKRK